MEFARFYPSQTEVVLYLVEAGTADGHTVERATFDLGDARDHQKELLELYGNASLQEMTQAEVDAKIEAELY